MLLKSSSVKRWTRSWRIFTTISRPWRCVLRVSWFRSTDSCRFLKRDVNEFTDGGLELLPLVPLDNADMGRDAETGRDGHAVDAAEIGRLVWCASIALSCAMPGLETPAE
mmetsp:Transcript_61621/g.144466  ORF Transcript_61621/g.144466 Transcript_61621/m.144466 type:complete len:110 (+) Transcript_61621:192-521(+)